jgi:hypothetical protein
VITYSSKKRRWNEDDQTDSMESSLTSQQPMVGETQVSYLVLHERGNKKLVFVPPVMLAPLQRKKVKTSKKVVPLIEPDICNYMRMDFLPEAVIRKIDTFGSSQQTLSSGTTLPSQQSLQSQLDTISPNY